MGTLKEFECPECGYTAEVSGGDDCGMIAMTKTMVCHTYRRLVDVLDGIQPFCKDYDPKIKRDIGRCPRCYGSDVEVWSSTWPCPKCRAEMNEGLVTLLWD